jgi:hypothetical protein
MKQYLHDEPRLASASIPNKRIDELRHELFVYM